MEIETLSTKTSYLRNNKFLNSSAFPYDLPKLIKKMKDTPGWKNGELAATILLKSPGKQIVLTVLHDDTEIKSYQSGDSITFQMIEGKMRFHSHEETVILENGQHMTLFNKIKFSLTTQDEESTFLLTINTGSSVPVGN
jgi:hypothetical protein